ncbi:class I SAM-dependent DNA methyltransferase [Salirhabdus sp. Marseille-P4669]|uniref:class I SAM-dependent DNA methyltransferase n=1 Tax=Salirhabdus sp. Marseille-P4669 TaxID=2042310 RepID=UPI000C7B96A9|nr:class I SAM-dependent methyltransferase [Salirhabdus sp. Marseille-P4669]
MESYRTFAHIYDTLMEDAPYEDWIHFTEHFVKKYNAGKSIIDLGCGTGEISIRFAQLGYDVTGVDLSTNMLAIANQKAQEQNVPIMWIHQNMIELETPNQYDIAVSYCDVINYLTDIEDVRRSFLNVHQTLKEDGLFLFDVHSEHYVNEFLANQTFAEVRDEVSYVWFCDQGEEESSVEHNLTFFIKKKEEFYERYDEYHYQRTFPISVYKKLVEESGFELIGLHSDFSTDSFHESGDRIFFVCKKR